MDERALSITRDLIDFLAKCPTAFQAADEIGKELEAAGFQRLQEGTRWEIVPGGRYFLTRNMSSVVAWRMPTGRPESVMIAASHTDSPSFKIKANAENEAFGQYLRLNTERYGGAILSSWFDRPLGIAGRAIVRRGDRFEAVPVDLGRDLCVIPNVCIHLTRGMPENHSINPAVDTFPLFGEIASKGALSELVARAAGAKSEEIAGSDLFLYDRTGGRVWGAGSEFFSSPRIDNMQCAWATLRGFLAAAGSESAVQVWASFDNEETGSATKQGAGSALLLDSLTRACASQGVALQEILASSFMLSADNGHAVHPNHPELNDRENAPHMNGGVVVKYNAAQKYTTDAVSAALFGEICRRAGVPTQVYANRSDLPGGGTLGSISNTRVAMNTVDIGLAQLAMHSCWETGGCADTLCMVEAAAAFYLSRIEALSDGSWELL